MQSLMQVYASKGFSQKSDSPGGNDLEKVRRRKMRGDLKSWELHWKLPSILALDDSLMFYLCSVYEDYFLNSMAEHMSHSMRSEGLKRMVEDKDIIWNAVQSIDKKGVEVMKSKIQSSNDRNGLLDPSKSRQNKYSLVLQQDSFPQELI